MTKYSYVVLKRKNSTQSKILNSVTETSVLMSFNDICLQRKKINNNLFNIFFSIKKDREVGNCVYKDLLGLITMWRQIRGYPGGGSTTHTNAKTARKAKLLFFYRLNQFNVLFGSRRRNIYPSLIKAEYNNRLWFTNWHGEWLQASRFALGMIKTQDRHGGFNPAILAGNQTNGYTRIGAAAKVGKSKKLVKLFTIGVPIFFTRFIYYEKLPKFFSYRLMLKEDVNKKLGKKIKKNKKK